jgi:hypothetical protein
MIIRCKVNRRFTTIPNELVTDEELSFEALGLLAYLFSRPDDWHVSVEQIKERGGIGRDKAQGLVRELIDLGYVKPSEVMT